MKTCVDTTGAHETISVDVALEYIFCLLAKLYKYSSRWEM